MLRIQFERSRRGLTQHTLGVLVHVHQPTIALIEHGRFIPTPAQLQRFADLFGVPAESLLKPVVLIPVDDLRAFVEQHQASTGEREVGR